jgi:uncharacterized protein
LIALALLAVALVALGWAVNADLGEFRRFLTLEYTHTRQRMFLWWVVKYFLLFVVMPLGGLALLGRLDALWTFPAEFAAVAGAIPTFGIDGDATGFIGGALLGALIGGGVIGGILAARAPEPPPTEQSVMAMMPRNPAETGCTALLSLNAGLGEEIFFRLYLPLLLVAIGMGAGLAFVLAGLLFGFAHLYQGIGGVVVTAVIGAVMAVIYLLSGSLWIAIAVHALIDLNALVLRPAITRTVRNRRARAD